MTKRIAAIGLAGVLALVAWAWIDGGREPLREISVLISVPDSAR